MLHNCCMFHHVSLRVSLCKSSKAFQVCCRSMAFCCASSISLPMPGQWGKTKSIDSRPSFFADSSRSWMVLAAWDRGWHSWLMAPKSMASNASNASSRCEILSDSVEILTFWKVRLSANSSHRTELGLDGFNCLLVAVVGRPHLPSINGRVDNCHPVLKSHEIAVPALVVTNTSSRFTRPSAKAADNARPMPSSFPQTRQVKIGSILDGTSSGSIQTEPPYLWAVSMTL